MTERPFQDRSEVVKELYSELNTVKPQSGAFGHNLSESKIIHTNTWTFSSQTGSLVAPVSVTLLLIRVLHVITK